MPLSISILGANGVYARHLIPRLAARGHNIRALVRRPESATVAAQCGAEVRAADIYDPESVRAGVAGTDIAVNLATALGQGDFAANDRLRREGVPVFLAACQDAGVSRVLQQSIGMICGSGTDAWTDERDAMTAEEGTAAASAFAATFAMEEAVRASSLDWLILRGGLFYGPGTGYDDGWFERARAGRLRMPGDGTAFMSLVHIADMAEATVETIERWPSREALIVADDDPPRWGDLFNYIAALAGAAPPEPGGQLGFPSNRLRNAKVKDLLGWAPHYPTHRSGLIR